MLMFIPAFVLAVFLYSLFENYRIQSSFRYKFHSDKKGNYLKIFIRPKIKYNFILGYISNSGKIQFLKPDYNGQFKLEQDKKYKLVLYVFGSFDIFRKIVHI